MRVPPLISTPEAVKTELDLLKALEDIEVAFSIIKKKSKTVNEHPADKNYGNLKCEIKPIPAGDRMDKVCVCCTSSKKIAFSWSYLESYFH